MILRFFWVKIPMALVNLLICWPPHPQNRENPGASLALAPWLQPAWARLPGRADETDIQVAPTNKSYKIIQHHINIQTYTDGFPFPSHVGGLNCLLLIQIDHEMVSQDTQGGTKSINRHYQDLGPQYLVDSMLLAPETLPCS